MIPFTIMLHGESGVGKSTQCDTTPAPRLILDAEGRSQFAAGRKVYWDPFLQAPPIADGSWDTCIVNAPDYETALRVKEWLLSGQHPFLSVCMDSLMMIQKRFIDGLVGAEKLEWDDWGSVLRHLESLVMAYQSLAAMPSNPVQMVVVTVGSKDMDGKMRPLLQGGLRDTVPYYFDVIGYLYTDLDAETGQIARKLLVQPTQKAVAKDGTRLLPGPIIENPNIGQIFLDLNQQAAAAIVEKAPASTVQSLETQTEEQPV